MAKRHKTLILHIGDHKTGSTSIQLAFAENRVRLKGKRVFYPAKLASNALGRQAVAYSRAKSAEERAKRGKPFAQLAERIAGADADFALISAEAFETVPAAVTRDILDTFFRPVVDEIRVIAYVRPHAARIVSSFAERIKTGVLRLQTMNLEEFARLRHEVGEFDYLPRFSEWRRAFGENFQLRPMIRQELRNGSVVDDFIHHAFGGIPFEVELAERAANESLTLEDLMRLKVLHSHLRGKSKDLRLKVGWEVARVLGGMEKPAQQTRLALHAALAREIRDWYLADARKMDAEFFGGASLMEGELTRAVEEAVPAPVSSDPADYFSAEELRSLEVMSRLVSTLLEAEGVDWEAFLHSQRVKDVAKAKKRGAGRVRELLGFAKARG